MDPLSITASILAVAGAAATTGKAFSQLRLLCKTLPGRLHALSNEVADIELVLCQVAALVEDRRNDPIIKDQQTNISHLLERAQARLDELRAILQKLTDICEETKVSIFRIHAWRKDQPRLQLIQEDIKSVKCSLNIMLGASNSCV